MANYFDKIGNAIKGHNAAIARFKQRDAIKTKEELQKNADSLTKQLASISASNAYATPAEREAAIAQIKQQINSVNEDIRKQEGIIKTNEKRAAGVTDFASKAGMSEDKWLEQYKSAYDDEKARSERSVNPKTTGNINNVISAGLSGAIGAAAGPLMGEGNAADKSDVHLEEQARAHEQEAAKEQAQAAQNRQIANRDYRVEADKNAAATAAQKAQNYVANSAKGNDAANRLAAAEKTLGEVPDYNTQMARQDTQRKEAVANERTAQAARQVSIAERAGADRAREVQRQINERNNNAWALSNAGKEVAPITNAQVPEAGPGVNEEPGNPETQVNATGAEETAEQPAQNWTLNDIQNAINISRLPEESAIQRMSERGVANPQAEFDRLRPLVAQVNSDPKTYEALLQNERPGNLSPEENKKWLAKHGSTPINTNILNGLRSGPGGL